MGRICIVTSAQLGSNPRTVKEADALSAAGHQVTVIATKVLASVEPRDQAVLARAKWEVRRVDFGALLPRMPDRLVQLGAAWLDAVTGATGAALFSHSERTRRLAATAKRVSADLYIAHYVAALPAAAMAARWHGGRFAFDAEDFHLGDLPDAPAHALEKRIIGAIEARYLPYAAYVSAAAPMIAEAYANAYGITKPDVILNVFPTANAAASSTSRGTATPGPSLYWFSQTIGPGRGIETAIQAIAYAKSAPHLYLRGQSSDAYAFELLSLAQRAGIAERLHFLDPTTPGELERCGAEFDLGYVGEQAETFNRQIALTNKLFSYLTSGLPIVATDITSHQRLAPELGEAIMLFPVGNPVALAHAIDEFLLNPERLEASRAHSWSLGQSRFNWDLEQANLLKIVEKAIK